MSHPDDPGGAFEPTTSEGATEREDDAHDDVAQSDDGEVDDTNEGTTENKSEDLISQTNDEAREDDKGERKEKAMEKEELQSEGGQSQSRRSSGSQAGVNVSRKVSESTPPVKQQTSETSLTSDAGSQEIAVATDEFLFWRDASVAMYSRDGEGSYQNPSTGASYEGQWKDNKASGTGTLKLPNGDEYYGRFKENLPNGFGQFKYNGGVYQGMWLDGKPSGNGKHVFAPDRNVYRGDWVKGRMQGYGIYRWGSGEVAIGQFVCGKMEGFGFYKWSHQDFYIGEFKAGQRHGWGRRVYAGHHIYQGQWMDNSRQGLGAKYYADRNAEEKAKSQGRADASRKTWVGEWEKNQRARKGAYPEDVEEVKAQMLGILEKLKNNSLVKHTLTTLDKSKRLAFDASLLNLGVQPITSVGSIGDDDEESPILTVLQAFECLSSQPVHLQSRATTPMEFARMSSSNADYMKSKGYDVPAEYTSTSQVS